MRYSLVVSQQINDIELVACTEDMGERIQRSAMGSVFPAGSDWGDYLGARSFRFVPIAYKNYLLSFTLVLNEDQGEWDGQLHAWGLVGPLDTFLTKSSLGGLNPRDLFINNSHLFEIDDLYDTMLEGLQPTSPSVNNIRFSRLVRLLWRGQKAGFSWRFTDTTQWSNIENWLYMTFQYSLPGNNWWRRSKQPKTFSTFTLSTSEPTEIIGFPNKDIKKPVFGFV